MAEGSQPEPDVLSAGTVVNYLVEGYFRGASRLTGGRNLSAEELEREVATIGEPLGHVPGWELRQIPVSACTGAHEIAPGDEFDPFEHLEPGVGYDFVIPLWTASGRSGVGVSFHLIPTSNILRSQHPVIVGFIPIDPRSYPGGPSEVPQPRPTVARTSGAWGLPERSPVPVRWRPLLHEVVHRLVMGDYDGLAAEGLVAGSDLPESPSIGHWIEEYPGTLNDVPAEGWLHSDHWPNDWAPGSWSVVLDLWTVEEGLSDLSLEATVWDDGDTVRVRIDNVHVM